MARRYYSSTAGSTTLTADITAGATSATVSSAVGYPTTPFFLTIDRGTASEEVVLVTNRSGNNLTITRGQDGTVGYAHLGGAVVEHTFTATDADEANAHVNATTGVHGLGGGESFASQTFTNNAVTTHATLTSGVHGVGASEVASKAYVDAADATNDAALSSHASATTGVHGVGASTVASQAYVDTEVAALLDVVANGTTDWSTSPAPSIGVEMGATNRAICNTTGTDTTVTFKRAFAAAPFVVVGSSSTSTLDPRGFVFAYNITTTGMTVKRIASTTDQIMQAHWIAVGQRT